MKKYFISLGVVLLILCSICIVDNICIRNMLNKKEISENKGSDIDCIKEETNKQIRGINIATQVDLFNREPEDNTYDTIMYTSSNRDVSVYISYADTKKKVEDVSKVVVRHELGSDKYAEGYWLYKDFKVGDRAVIVTIIGVRGSEQQGNYIYDSLRLENSEQI